MANLFDAPSKDADGTWHTNKLAQLYTEAKEALTLNPASWLGALGLVLLLDRLRELYKSGEGLLRDAGLTMQEAALLQPFFDAFAVYTLPPGYVVDADAKNPLVESKPSELHVEPTVVVCVDLLALAALVQKCCDVVAAQVASGAITLPDSLKLKAK